MNISFWPFIPILIKCIKTHFCIAIAPYTINLHLVSLYTFAEYGVIRVSQTHISNFLFFSVSQGSRYERNNLLTTLFPLVCIYPRIDYTAFKVTHDTKIKPISYTGEVIFPDEKINVFQSQ